MTGGECEAKEIRLARVLGATRTLSGFKGSFGINLTFEPGQEGGARWCGVCGRVSYSGVQLVCRQAGAQHAAVGSGRGSFRR